MTTHLLTLAACLWTSAAHAQPAPVSISDTGTSQLIDSVLSATRLPSPWHDESRLPSQARIITADDIARSNAKTLPQLLAALPGAVYFEELGSGFEQTFDLRGFNAQPAPATAVFIDGVRVNETDFGAINYQTLALCDIERVEVLPGPQTLYGKNAMSGVISIFTKKGASKPHAEAAAEAGSFDRRRLQAEISGPAAGALDYRLSAQRESELGYRANSAGRLQTFDGRLSYRDADQEASLTYLYGDDDIKQAGSLTSSEISQDRRQNVSAVEMDSLSHLVSLNARKMITDELSLSGNVFARERLENTPLNKGRTSISRSRADKPTSGGALQLEHKAEIFGRRSLLTAGGELSRAKVDSDSSGSFSGSPFISGSLVRERQAGVYIQEALDLLPNALTLTGGVRYDNDTLENQDKSAPSNNGTRGFTHISPRAGLNFNPAAGVELFASLAESFRTPTPSEISALGPFSSSPELKPVKARSFELGARLHKPRLDATLSIFRTVVRDEIYAVYDPTAGFGQNKNIPKSRRDGLEITLEPRLNDSLSALINYSYTEATFQTSFGLDKPPFPATQSVQSGAFLPQVPRHRLTAGINARPLEKLLFTVEESCVGSQYLLGDESNTERRLGGYCLTGLRASYESGPVEWFLRVDNLLNRSYETRGILGTNPTTFGLERFMMPAAGITVAGGARYKIF